MTTPESLRRAALLSLAVVARDLGGAVASRMHIENNERADVGRHLTE